MTLTDPPAFPEPIRQPGRQSRLLVCVIGIGNLVVAGLWSYWGWRHFSEVGTRTFELQLSEFIAQMRPPGPGPRQQRPQKRRETRRQAERPVRPNPLNMLGWKSPEPTPAEIQRGQDPPSEPKQSPPRPQTNGQAPNSLIAEFTRQAWATMMAIVVGIVSVSGLSLLLSSAASRRRARRWLGLLIPLALVRLLIAWADKWRPGGVESFANALKYALVAMGQSRYAWAEFLLLAAAVMGLVGALALRAKRREATWATVTMAALFTGTAGTLVGLAILIRYAGFPPLPSIQYGKIAVALSGWAWILLFLQRPLARATAEAPVTGLTSISDRTETA